MLKEYLVTKNDSNQRLDKFIHKTIPLLPISLLNKAIRTKDIKVNKARTENNYILQENDVIRVYLKDEFFQKCTPNEYEFLHAGKQINIIYEDDNFIILDKPAGLLVHEDDTHVTDTLINRVLRYLYETNQYIPDSENSFTPSLCHRLDRNTSGLVICAKNFQSLQFMNDKIKNRDVKKQYTCLVVGKPSKSEDICTAYLMKDENKKEVTIFNKPLPNTKEIITEYQIIGSEGNLTELYVTLHTGRTHQIRAHLAYLGFPILGDTKYCNKESLQLSKKYKLNWQCLNATCITFHFKDNDLNYSYLNGKMFQSKIDVKDMLKNQNK